LGVAKVYDSVSTRQSILSGRRSCTFDPKRHNLKSVYHLRIKARGQLDTHASREEHEIKISQVWLSVPWHLVLLHDGGEDWIRGAGGLEYRFKEAHVEFKWRVWRNEQRK
jgi:hypothetical protein